MKQIKIRKIDLLTGYISVSNEYRRNFLLNNLEKFCNDGYIKVNNKRVLEFNRKNDYIILNVNSSDIYNFIKVVKQHNEKVYFERKFNKLIKD